MADKIVSLTMEGKAKLEAELAELKSTKREEIAEKIKIDVYKRQPYYLYDTLVGRVSNAVGFSNTYTPVSYTHLF